MGDWLRHYGAVVDSSLDVPLIDQYGALRELAERRLEIVTALLEHGTDPNGIPDGQGRGLTAFDTPYHETALLLATRSGNLQLIDLLLEHGADPALRIDGVSPLSLAESTGHLDLLRRLRRRIAVGSAVDG